LFVGKKKNKPKKESKREKKNPYSVIIRDPEMSAWVETASAEKVQQG